MRILKLAVAAALCLTIALVIQRGIVTRYQCSAEKKRTELWLVTASESGSPERALSVARGAIPRLMRCVESDPSDYEALFLLGQARSAAEQREAALQTFQASLAINERPETYANVGILQLEAGNAEEARRNLLQAVYFHANIITEVEDTFGLELFTAAEERQRRLNALKKERGAGQVRD